MISIPELSMQHPAKNETARTPQMIARNTPAVANNELVHRSDLWFRL